MSLRIILVAFLKKIISDSLLYYLLLLSMAISNISTKSDHLQLSTYLYDNYDLWVWDFDDTLIDTTTYYITSMKPEDIKKRDMVELDQEIPHWRYFVSLVQFLVGSGKRVGIASFGTYEIIQAYMDRIFGFGQKYFTRKNIMAACKAHRISREYKMPINKNSYIYDLMQLYKIQDYQKVVLFDDLSSNISDALAIGILGIKIQGRDQNGIGNPGNFFGPDIMSAVDYSHRVNCDGQVSGRRHFGAVGDRKARHHENRMAERNVRYILPNRIYSPNDPTSLPTKKSTYIDEDEDIRLENLYTNTNLRYSDEGFTNRRNNLNKKNNKNNKKINNKNINNDEKEITKLPQCNYCTSVMNDKLIWLLLITLIIFLYMVV
jgi:hypothetical protein